MILQERLTPYQSKLEELSQRLNFLEGKKTFLKEQLSLKQSELEQIKEDGAIDDRCGDLFKKLSLLIQQGSISTIETFVTRIYQYVFQCSDVFKIEYELKRSVPSMKFVIVSNGLVQDPMESLGGGTIDVLAFALRLATLILVKPRPRQVLILDESFKHLSVQYRPRMADILDKLSKECNIQIIMTTHQSEFLTTKDAVIFEITNEGGESFCKKYVNS